MKDYKNAFIQYLCTAGAKFTKQRQLILEAVFATHEHFDAESLYQQIIADGNAEFVSLTSIYRTLPLLLNAGLIKRCPGSANKEQYEHVYGHPDHSHLECLRCGKIIEDKLTAQQKEMMQQLCKKFHFQATELELHLVGYCENCRSVQGKVKS